MYLEYITPYNSVIKTSSTIFLNGQKTKSKNKHVTKKDIQVTKKYTESLLTSLVIGKVQITAAVRYHCTPRMAKTPDVGEDIQQL